MDSFYIFYRASEGEPPRFCALVADKESAEDAITGAIIGEGEYLAFPAETVVIKPVKATFQVGE